MKKKEEVTITFYAAECGEFHDLGEYTKCRTLEEAYKKYQKYCRTSANMCPAIEFSIHDPESNLFRHGISITVVIKRQGRLGTCAILQRTSTGK